MKRKNLSKKLRFEIFKRDGFRCVYCGVTPVQAALRVDHVVPVVDGGQSTPDNLVTACHDCNSGKSCNPLEKKQLTKPILRQSAIDHAEQIKEFLRVQRDISIAQDLAAEQFSEYWESRLGPMSQDMFGRSYSLLKEWPIERLTEAVNIVSRKLGKGHSFSSYHANRQAKYFHGILRKWRVGENENG